MAFTNEIKEKISLQAISVLYSRFESFPEDSSGNRNAPFHEAFLNAFADRLDNRVPDVPFFVSLSSWLHGLSTTLGQTFFENTAQILCCGEKREYTSKKSGNLKISRQQRTNIGNIIARLSTGQAIPDVERDSFLCETDTDSLTEVSMDFSADVFFVDEEDIFAIEMKSVRPNSSEMRGEKQKNLEGKVSLCNKFPDKNIHFFIGFPFDPTSDVATGSDKIRFMKSIINMDKYFDQNEVLLADELWNFLSRDDNTMQQILDIINTVANTDFLDRYNFINEPRNRIDNKPLYTQYLQDWNLYSELFLLENENVISANLNRSENRFYNQMILKKGKYNLERFQKLSQIVNNNLTGQNG